MKFSQTTSLAEVIASLLPFVDRHSEHLQWKGFLTVHEFVDHLFPFLADLMRNGRYDPDAFRTDEALGSLFFSDSETEQKGSASQEQMFGAGEGRGQRRSTTAAPSPPPSTAAQDEKSSWQAVAQHGALSLNQRAKDAHNRSLVEQLLSNRRRLSQAEKMTARLFAAQKSVQDRRASVQRRGSRRRMSLTGRGSSSRGGVQLSEDDENCLATIRNFRPTPNLELISISLTSADVNEVRSLTSFEARRSSFLRQTQRSVVPNSPTSNTTQSVPYHGFASPPAEYAAFTEGSPQPPPPPPPLPQFSENPAPSVPPRGNRRSEQYFGREDVSYITEDTETNSSYHAGPTSLNSLLDNPKLLFRRATLICEVGRIFSAPLPSNLLSNDPAAAQQLSFVVLKELVENLLTSLFYAADDAMEEKLQYMDFLSFLSDSAIVFNNQLALKDLSIYVEDVTKRVEGAVLFATITSYSRLVLVTQIGVAPLLLKILPVGSIDETTRPIVLPAMSGINGIEFLEDRMCLVISNDRGIHFLDMKYGAGNREFATLTLDALGDSPCCFRWVPERDLFVVGGISGFLWTVTAPVWNSAKRDWKPPKATSMTHRPHGMAASPSSVVTSPPSIHLNGSTDAAATSLLAPDSRALAASTLVDDTSTTHDGESSTVDPRVLLLAGGAGVGGVPINTFDESVSCITAAFTDGLFFIASRGLVSVFDVLTRRARFTHNAGERGMTHISGIVYNQYTKYLLGFGETLYLLVWLSPNLPHVAPVRLEDFVTPHSGHLVALESHPTMSTVISMDSHGLLKVWDLNSFMCTQTLHLHNRTTSRLLQFLPGSSRLHVVLSDAVSVYKADDETATSSIASIVVHPKGGSIVGAANRDVILWSTVDGKRLAQHQNISAHEIVMLCMAGSSVVALMNTNGDVSFHSVTSGKLLSLYNRKALNAEAVAIAYCKELRRTIVVSASPTVWFLPAQVTAIEEPFSLQLDSRDVAASGLAVGLCDKQTYYAISTVENAINIFVLKPPSRVHFRHRIAPLSTSAASEVVGSTASVSCMVLTSRHLVVADTIGRIHLFKGGRWTPSSVISLSEIIDRALIERMQQSQTSTASGAGGDLFDPMTISVLEIAGNALNSGSPSGGGGGGEDGDDDNDDSVGIPHVLCATIYKTDAILACGDSVGRLLFLDLTRSLDLLNVWIPHPQNACSNIAIENELILTTSEAAQLCAWSSDGHCLGDFWGSSPQPPSQQVLEDVSALPPPAWSKRCQGSLPSSSSMRRKRSNLNSSLLSTMAAALGSFRSFSRGSVESNHNMSTTQMMGGRGGEGSPSLGCGGGMEERASSPPKPMTQFASFVGFSRQGNKSATSHFFDDVPTVFSSPRSMRRAQASVVEPSDLSLTASNQKQLTSRKMSSSTNTVLSSLENSSTGTISNEEDEEDGGGGGNGRYGGSGGDSDENEDDTLSVSSSISSLGGGRSIGADLETSGRVSLQRSSPSVTRAPNTTVGATEAIDSLSASTLPLSQQQLIPTKLTPVLWRAKDVTAMDEQFRSLLGNQRVLHCVSRCLGLPDTTVVRGGGGGGGSQGYQGLTPADGDFNHHRATTGMSSSSANRGEVKHAVKNTKFAGHTAQNADVKVSKRVIPPGIAPGEPVHRIRLEKSGNIVFDHDVTHRRSKTSMF